MHNRKILALFATVCVLAIGFPGLMPAANAVSPGLSVFKRGESAGNNVIEIKGRGRGRSPRLYVPIVPYIAYDYPYYYSRGHYPTSIGRGYVYYGYPYSHYVAIYNARHGKRCANGNRNCGAGLGYRGPASSRRQRGAYR